jgi:hypothetical protein
MSSLAMSRMLLAALMLLLAPAVMTARAQKSEYDRVLDEALSEFQQGHFDEARALFEQAHALEPSARTLRGIGMTEFELRHYVRSLQLLQQSLVDARKPLTADLRAKTEQLVQRTERFVARFRMRLEPETATIEVDGASAKTEPDGMLWLDAGEHTLRVSSAGFAIHEQKLDAVGGSEQELAIRLEAASPAQASEQASAAHAPPTSSTQQAGDEPQSEAKRGPGPWPWVVVGISGAMMIGGGVLIAMAQSDASKVTDAPKGSRWSEIESAYHGAGTKSVAGFTLLGVGAAGVTAGLLWYFVGGRKSHDEPALSAAVGPTSLMLAGSF